MSQLAVWQSGSLAAWQPGKERREMYLLRRNYPYADVDRLTRETRTVLFSGSNEWKGD